MDKIQFKIRGIAPMLQHNSRLADPLDEYAKALKKISSKKKKTEEDFANMADIEMRGSLYWSKEQGLVVPGEMIEASIINGAKFKKLGATFKRSAQVVEFNCPLEKTNAPKDFDKLADDHNFRYVKSVKVGTSRVMRTRPIIHQWETGFTVLFDPKQIQKDDIIEAVESAGMMCGLGDWRPRFGKFEIVEAA